MFVYFQSCIEFIMAQQAHPASSTLNSLLIHFFFPYFNITQMDMSYIVYECRGKEWQTEAAEMKEILWFDEWLFFVPHRMSWIHTNDMLQSPYLPSHITPHPLVFVFFLLQLLLVLPPFFVPIMCIWIMCVCVMWGKM